jgi:hypothetical protein
LIFCLQNSVYFVFAVGGALLNQAAGGALFLPRRKIEHLVERGILVWTSKAKMAL